MAGKRKRTNRRVRDADGAQVAAAAQPRPERQQQPAVTRTATGAYVTPKARTTPALRITKAGTAAPAPAAAGGRGRGRGRGAGSGGGRGGGRGRGRGRGAAVGVRGRRDEDIASDDEGLGDSDADASSSESEDDAGGAAGGVDSDDDAEETAEEKRLRLAKEYLAQIEAEEAAARANGGGEEGDGGESDSEGDEDIVGARLRSEGLAKHGYGRRELGAAVRLPAAGGGMLLRGFRLPPTCVAVSADERVVYAASKDGTILAWEMDPQAIAAAPAEEGAEGAPAVASAVVRRRFAPVPEAARGDSAGAVGRARRGGGRRAADAQVLCMALSDDGALLATGGRDCSVHVWDAREGTHLQAFPGHKGAILGMCFRAGTRMLYTASEDRSVKIWSLDDMAYLDTLFGHQTEVSAVACARRERPVTCSSDRTCRAWKIHDETQLIFRGHSSAIDCVAALSADEWVTGGQDGCVAAWSLQRKKPTGLARHADAGASARDAGGEDANSDEHDQEGAKEQRHERGSARECQEWVGAVACSMGSDLAASGAGDGRVRLWQVGKPGTGQTALTQLGSLDAPGFVNGLALSVSGRTLVAAVGQEPRLGRWARNKVARNGVIVYRLGGTADPADDVRTSARMRLQGVAAAAAKARSEGIAAADEGLDGDADEDADEELGDGDEEDVSDEGEDGEDMEDGTEDDSGDSEFLDEEDEEDDDMGTGAARDLF